MPYFLPLLLRTKNVIWKELDSAFLLLKILEILARNVFNVGSSFFEYWQGYLYPLFHDTYNLHNLGLFMLTKNSGVILQFQGFPQQEHGRKFVTFWDFQKRAFFRELIISPTNDASMSEFQFMLHLYNSWEYGRFLRIVVKVRLQIKNMKVHMKMHIWHINIFFVKFVFEITTRMRL